LTLYNDEQIPDQISLFISNCRLQQLARLRSISLFGIDENQLNFILKRINVDHLTSFSIYIREYDQRRRKTTAHYISSIMAQATLRKVELNIKDPRLSTIQWPSNCRNESLTLNEYIGVDNLFEIIGCSPQLHQLIIKADITLMPNNLNQKSGFTQITSLSLEKMRMSIDDLEYFLSLTPSLIYLKLIGHSSVFDGKRWEEFLPGNLPHLNKFEFLISSLKSINQTRKDLKLILQSFQSPFWIEHKKWFVACAFHRNFPRTIQIYSIPICKTIFDDRLHSKMCFLSTSKHLLTLENFNQVDLRLEEPINNNLLKTIDTPFTNVTKLRLEFCDTMSTDVINHLQSIFNLSQLVEVYLESSSFDRTNKDHLFNVIKLIDQSSKLTSLTIHSRYWKSWIHPYLNDLCSILPRQIKYLQMPISEVKQIEMIFERCQHLSIAKFETIGRKYSSKIDEWFHQNTIDSTFRKQIRFTHVWIGKKINSINENPKRMKLMNKNQSN